MIDISGWGEFTVGLLFQCETTLSIPSKNDLVPGEHNYITRSTVSNGLSGYCGNTTHLNKGVCITIGAEGFVAFWQDDPFVAGNKVYAIRHPKMNEYSGLFVCSALNVLASRYSYDDARILDRITEEVIRLPVSSDGQPDWDYMESYMKRVIDRAERDLRHLQSSHGTKHPVDVTGWGEFPIISLFDLSLPKGDLQVKKVEDGTVPLITPSKYNNGQLKRISGHSPSTLYKKGSLTVDMFGNAFYQEEDFFVTAHGHVNVLLPKKTVNVYCGSFLASAIRAMFWDKYGFDEMCTQKVLKKETIRLPIVSEGEPDWEYMDAYMQQAMNDAECTVSTLECSV